MKRDPWRVVLQPRRCEFWACGRLYVPRRDHQRYCRVRCRELAKRRLRQVLYGVDHKRDRMRWAPVVATGTLICSWPDCGKPILRGQKWDLGHVPGQPSSPQHSACNRATAGRRS